MKKNFLKISMFAIAFAFISCSDDDNSEPWVEPKFDTAGAFILNEGLTNKAQIAYYDMENGRLTTDIFEQQNGLGLGDTGNDMLIYGSKMYTTVFGSDKIIVTDLKGKLIPEKGIIDVKDEKYNQPRYIAAHEGYIYVDFYSGYVAKIDTTDLKVVDQLPIKSYPEQMAISGNELYITNSNHFLVPVVGTTVTVVDLSTFKVKGDPIKVRVNPTRITSDDLGNVYVISMGDYYGIPSAVSVIDSKTKSVKEIGESLANTMQIQDNLLLMGYRDYATDVSTYKKYDIIKQQLVEGSFITIPEEHKETLGRVHGISCDPIKKDIYITTPGETWDAKGNVFIFTKNGEFKKHLAGVGVGPNKVEFTSKQIN